MSELAPQLPAMDNTMGALFIGVLMAMGLWGVGCVQMYYYFNRYTKDDWTLKSLVIVVWGLDTAHQGLITHSLYTYLVTEYANPLALLEIVPSLLHEVIVSAIICFLVQCFLVLRVWKLSHKNIFVVGSLMLLVIGELVVSFVYTAQALPFKTFANLTKIVDLSRSINILAAIGDVAIAGCLIFLLNRSRTGFKHSENVINKLILFTINTGALTSLFAIMSMVTITVFPDTFIYILFYVNMSRLYTNTLFATLNARKSLRGGHPDDTENGQSSISMGRIRPRVEVESSTLNKMQNPRAISIKVDTETARDDGHYHQTPISRTGSDKTNRAGSDSNSDVSHPPYYNLKSELPV